MKFKSVSSIISLFLALMFCVAVSGGCGGGSSGHYYGNFGNSSQDVTPEPDSQDVVPENPTSDDEYGNNNDWEVVSFFSGLNNTEWVISSVYVYVTSNRQNCTILPNSYNYNVDKLTLQIFDDTALLFYDGNGMPYGNWYSPLTVKVKTPSGKEFAAPILRSAEGFTRIRSTEYYDMWRVDFKTDGMEKLDIYKRIPSTYVIVYNTFYIDNVEYNAYIELNPYNK